MIRRSLAAPLALFGTLTLSAILLAVATLAPLESQAEDRWRRQSRRYWEDVHMAIGHQLSGQFPVSYRPWEGYQEGDRRGYQEVRPTLGPLADAAGIRAWQFWRTVPTEAFERRKPPPIVFRFDDPGRSLLLSTGFGLLGGVAPFLTFWLGLAAALPVLAWVAVELTRARLPVAAAAFLLLVGLSPFVADVLALSYSALGFYLVALFGLTASAVYVCLGSPTPRGLCFRAAAVGLLLGVCALCRSSSLLLLPGFALAAAVAVRRLGGRSGAALPRSRRLAAVALAAALVALPYLALQQGVQALIRRTLDARGDSGALPPQVHPVWHGLWIGLGDFGGAKGYRFDDYAGFEAAVAGGGVPATTTFWPRVNERVLRDQILRDAASDPAWLAGVLGKRLLAALTLWKLWPWQATSGVSLREGDRIEAAYYSLARLADHVAIGPAELELPVPLLLAPTALLLALAWKARKGEAKAAADRHASLLLVLAAVAAGALGHPVLITTASALETEALVVVYYLGAAFAAQALVARRGAGRETAL